MIVAVKRGRGCAFLGILWVGVRHLDGPMSFECGADLRGS
jgi:uncharacterized membrane protein YeiB